MIGLMIGIIFFEFDEIVVNIVMLMIICDFGGLFMYGWVVGIYMLVLFVFMFILGKLVDLFS